MALFMGGVFNVALLGLPLYTFVWCFTLLVAGVLYVSLWAAWWKPLEPLKGVWFAQKFDTNCCLIFDKYFQGEIVDEASGKCIISVENPDEFENPDKWGRLEGFPEESPIEAWWRKRQGVDRTVKWVEMQEKAPLERAGHVRIQGVRCDLICDSNNWSIRGSPAHTEIVEACVAYNEEHPDDQVYTYQKFARRVFEKKIPCPPKVELFEEIPWSYVDSCFPLQLGEHMYAGKKRELVTKLQEASADWIRKLAYIILLGGIGVSVLVLVIRLVLHFA